MTRRRLFLLMRHFWLGITRGPRNQWHIFHSHDERGFCRGRL